MQSLSTFAMTDKRWLRKTQPVAATVDANVAIIKRLLPEMTEPCIRTITQLVVGIQSHRRNSMQTFNSIQLNCRPV